MRSILLIASASLIGLFGCTKATVIGTTCSKDSDCNAVQKICKTDGTCETQHQVCAPGLGGGASICTHVCTGSTGTLGCPIGYDCFPTDPAKGATCNKALYEFDATTGAPLLIGHDCSLDDGVCGVLGSKNAAVICRKIPDESADPPTPVRSDPSAYCTGVCASDADCPLDFVCDTDYDCQKKCLRRTLCVPCTVDANCPAAFSACVPTKDGKARYCTKPCAGPGDCGGVQNTALSCESTTNAAGVAISACLHRYGACLGEGKICDPCRTDADCIDGSKTCPPTRAGGQPLCITNTATGERFCTKGCKTDAACSAFGTVPAACDNTDIATAQNPGGMSLQFCNGDVDHGQPGLFSCWLP